MAAEGTTPKKGFSLDITPKRAAVQTDSTNTGGDKKKFKLSDMKLEPARPTTQRATPTNAPVNVCVYLITESSGDLWPAFPGSKLWQVGNPNITTS